VATLWVVATPIGNLADLGTRAAEVLATTEVVAAESVRRTRGLLSHLGVSGRKLISCREANRRRAAAEVVGHLDAGRDVALVSDAGTPGVSDPAAAVVTAAVAAGHRVSPIPGPSSLAALLSVSGLARPQVLFLGFLPVKAGPRRRLLRRAAEGGWALAIFEAPHRLAATARDLAEVVGDRPVVMAREISKLHEEVVHTTCRRLAQRAAAEPIRGEISLLVFGHSGQPQPAQDDQEVERLLRRGLAQGAEAPARLAKRVAAECGRGKDEVYKLLMRIKQDRDG